MALMLTSTTLDRGDSTSPVAMKRSRRQLGRRDCSAQGVVSGGQEDGRSWQAIETAWHRVGRSRQGGMRSRPPGVGVDSAKESGERRGAVSGMGKRT